MKTLRLKLMISLYEWSSKIYVALFKRKTDAWNINKTDLEEYPKGSLGYMLGQFYRDNGFDVMPKLENHDVFHVLTATGTDIQDEIAMQYLLLGNGKLSLYLFGMIIIGGIIFPEYGRYYFRSFVKGRRFCRFYDIDFEQELSTPFHRLQISLFRKQITLI